MQDVSVDYGSIYTVPACTFTRTGYDFLRWNTASDGTGTAYFPGNTFTVTGDVTLYATWSLASMTITFNANGGTGTMASGTTWYNTNYTTPANGFTFANHTFEHWATQADGGGSTYNAGAVIFNVTSNMTLYAIWQEVTALVLINFDDGRTLDQIFDTVADASGMMSIQNVTAMSGYALRRNLGAEHSLDLTITGISDFWVQYDVYIQSTLALPQANVFAPLVLMHDTASAEQFFLGVPLHNGSSAPSPIGFDALMPLTNVTPETVANTFSAQTIPIPNPLGRWINIKYHVNMDDIAAGLTVYIDDVLAFASTPTGEMPTPVASFDLLQIIYHDAAAPDTTIYMDNIGVYLNDPDA